MEIAAVLGLFSDLNEAELTVWVERGWVRAEPASSGWVFEEVDVARIRLIHDLRRTMEVDDGAVPIVLSLLDQVYVLRGELRAVLHALECQPEPVRSGVLQALGQRSMPA